MIKFLIQTIDGEVKHDFSFALIESLRYQAWADKTSPFMYTYMDTNGLRLNQFKPIYSDYIPVGSVEFVSDFLFQFFGKIPLPINIPAELMSEDFTHRHVKNGTELDIVQKSFVKSNDKIKSFTEICDHAPIGNYQISDIIEIESEWRAFVYNGELVGLQNYSGSFTEFPNVYLIKVMINAYKSAPIAYTLDVAITKGGWTSVIEAHDFFSCGLYGFADHKILPFMFSRWYQEYIRNLPF
jgi:hypothetical protein